MLNHKKQDPEMYGKSEVNFVSPPAKMAPIASEKQIPIYWMFIYVAKTLPDSM